MTVGTWNVIQVEVWVTEYSIKRIGEVQVQFGGADQVDWEKGAFQQKNFFLWTRKGKLSARENIFAHKGSMLAVRNVGDDVQR